MADGKGQGTLADLPCSIICRLGNHRPWNESRIIIQEASNGGWWSERCAEAIMPSPNVMLGALHPVPRQLEDSQYNPVAIKRIPASSMHILAVPTRKQTITT